MLRKAISGEESVDIRNRFDFVNSACDLMR